MTTCKWTFEKVHEIWKTECGNEWTINEGTPEEQGWVHCPFCGEYLEGVETGPRVITLEDEQSVIIRKNRSSRDELIITMKPSIFNASRLELFIPYGSPYDSDNYRHWEVRNKCAGVEVTIYNIK